MHFSSEAESLQQKKLDSGKSKKGFLYSLNVLVQGRAADRRSVPCNDGLAVFAHLAIKADTAEWAETYLTR